VSHRRPPGLGLALALVVLAAGCGLPPADAGQPPPEFTVGTITFRLVSGGVKRSGGLLHLYLSDQPDTCAAVAFTPVGTATYLVLDVAPPASGPLSATVVPPKLAPATGEAVGRLERRTGGALGLGYDAADGSLSWTPAPDGTVTVDALDVGFVDRAAPAAAVAGRVTGAGLVLRDCD